jgi:hypothetical protein
MNPHRDWSYEYGKYNGGDLFLGDDLIDKIIGRGDIKLLLKYGRLKNLFAVLYILGLTKNLISMSKMSSASVQAIFKKDHYKMV